MRSLHIIMPMAGEGTRFLKEGWTTPKPLIELKGIPLFVRAIRSVIMDDINLKYSFIVRQEHIDRYHINEYINSCVCAALCRPGAFLYFETNCPEVRRPNTISKARRKIARELRKKLV